ncbi:hypothetical protein TWF718_011226 [Orbilia javanica]|uniref:Uncharacterized protein n=1 Tax=Orbilia javanica TaxID=47235 RepID=A0AAN8ML36_9PEZI
MIARPDHPFRNLHYDAIFEILLRIDNKPDLENLCLAYPYLGGIVNERRYILNRLYWEEIRYDFFMPLVLVSSALTRSEVYLEILLSLLPPENSGDGEEEEEEGEEEEEEEEESAEGEGDIPKFQEIDIESTDMKKTIKKLIDSLSPDTALAMAKTHRDIEKLAYIFMNNQLEQHHPPPQACRSPTAGERTRVMMAIYRAYVMVLMRFVNQPGFPVSASLYNTYLEIAELMRPAAEQDVFHLLWREWDYWDLKEVGIVLDKLWFDLPVAIFREALGTGLDVDTQFVNVLQSRVRRREDSHHTEMEWIDDMISYMFSARTWNPEKHAEFLGYLGRRRRSSNWIIVMIMDGESLEPFILWEDTPNCHQMNAVLRTHIYYMTALRIRFLETEAIREDMYINPGVPLYCRPPARRLVKGATGRVIVPTTQDLAFSRVARTWLSPNQENVCTAIEDCLWDDWRLEEWGYHFPEFVEG